MKPPKAGSRKATVYDVFVKSGVDAAVAKAVSLDLKAGTAKAWASSWSGGSKNSEAPSKARPVRSEKSGGTAPLIRFDHDTRERAVVHIQGVMRRTGMSQAAFHILEQEGKFAVVAAHQVPGIKIPQFEVGDWVCDTIIPDTLGKVVEAGPQQCVIKYEKPRPGYMIDTTIIPNVYLVKMPVPEKKVRERIEGVPAKANKSISIEELGQTDVGKANAASWLKANGGPVKKARARVKIEPPKKGKADAKKKTK